MDLIGNQAHTHTSGLAKPTTKYMESAFCQTVHSWGIRAKSNITMLLHEYIDIEKTLFISLPHKNNNGSPLVKVKVKYKLNEVKLYGEK